MPGAVVVGAAVIGALPGAPEGVRAGAGEMDGVTEVPEAGATVFAGGELSGAPTGISQR